MTRLIGILVMVLVLYAVLVGAFPTARSAENHFDLAKRLGFYGVLTLGAGTLIISGGIDLSMGSLVGLCAVGFGLMLERQITPVLAALVILAVAPVAGLIHGLLVTRLRLQPFLVTLCGLFIYRGIARSIAPTSVGLGRSASGEFAEKVESLVWFLVKGRPLGVPNILLLLLVIAGLLAVLLHCSVYGRYLYAIGANEQAARYAGISTGRYKILAYVISSTLAGLGGILFLLDNDSATATSAGQFLELYAITGAVLGGCSLRGGEGAVAGMLLGAAVLPLLNKICNFSPYITSELDYAVIGIALLFGTIINELIARRSRV